MSSTGSFRLCSLPLLPVCEKHHVLPDHFTPGEDAAIVGQTGRHVENESETRPVLKQICRRICRFWDGLKSNLLCGLLTRPRINDRVFRGWTNCINQDVWPFLLIKFLLKKPVSKRLLGFMLYTQNTFEKMWCRLPVALGVLFCWKS